MKEIIERMHDVHALVIGDAIIDRYVFGRVERVCPEAPVPVFIAMSEEARHGGAMHVVDQLRALEVNTAGMHGQPFSTKTRFMVGHQMVGLRVDEDYEITTPAEAGIAALSSSLLGETRCDVMVLSDYNKGTLKPGVCQYLIKFATENNIPVIVDPKGSWTKYLGATVICPNDKEIDTPWCGVQNILHKRGSLGLRLYGPREKGKDPPTIDEPQSKDRPVQDFPARAKHVFDVTGAGDVVVAVLAAALGAKATMTQAAELANIAAGWSVGEVGTVYITKEKLLELV